MNNSSFRRCLVFYLGTGLYAIDIAQVAEVRDISPRFPIPGSPECLAGAMNFHGNVTAVADTGALLGIAGNTRYENEVVLTREIASLALLTGRILRIMTMEPEEGYPSDSGTDTSFRIPEGDVRLLDGVRIAEMTETFIDGRHSAPVMH